MYQIVKRNVNNGSLNNFRRKISKYNREVGPHWLFNINLILCRLIDDFLTTGTITAPKRSLPLPLSYTVPPILIYGLLLVLIACSKVGRTVWLGVTLVYTLLGYLLIQCNVFQ